MKRKLHLCIREEGRPGFGFDAVTNFTDTDIVDLLSVGCLWKSVKHDGFPRRGNLSNLLMYSEKHDEICTGWWHDGEFDPDDGALYYLRTEKSITHYMQVRLPKTS